MRTELIGNATLILGDCLEVLPTLPGHVQAVITDPPFEADAHTLQRRVLGKGITRSRDLDNQPLPFPPLTPEQRDGLADWAARRCHGWFLAFCQTEGVGAWRAALEAFGAKWRRTGIWVKPDGSPQLSGDRPAQGHEAIAMAWCGDGRSIWNGGGKRGVFTFCKHDGGTGHGGAPKDHPTQKPLALMEELVSLFTQPGDIVCDPFMGSGTTGVACANQGRAFVGIETNDEYFAIAVRRIRAAYAQQRLFA
jgi:site-specific DNA-methyltransferase (adenine-specific)